MDRIAVRTAPFSPGSGLGGFSHNWRPSRVFLTRRSPGFPDGVLGCGRSVEVHAVAEAVEKMDQGGHLAIMQGLGSTGGVSPTHLPWLLRISHVR